MVKKVRVKFPLFLVSILVVLCLSLFVASVSATLVNIVTDGDFEAVYPLTWEASYYAQRIYGFSHLGDYCLGSPYDGNYHSYNLYFELENATLVDAGMPNASVYVFGATMVDNAHFVVGYNDSSYDSVDVSGSGVPQEWTKYEIDLDHGKFVSWIQLDFNYQPSSGAGIWFDDLVINVDDTVVEPPAEPPAGGATDDIYSQFMALLVPLLLIMIPSFVFAVYLKMGVFGIILGASIGAGLGYVFLPTYVPLWLLFIIIICDVAVAYRSMR